MKEPADYGDALKKAERAAYLIAGHIAGTLSDVEKEELDDWITESDENLELFERLTDEENIEAGLQQYLEAEKRKAAAFEKVREGIDPGRRRKSFWPYVVAASIIIIAVSLFLFPKNKKEENAQAPLAKATDIAPGRDKAVLTLSDGRTVILDQSASGLIASEGKVAIHKTTEGSIEYQGSEEPMQYNTVSTPRGGQFRLVLADGTKIWLNAESSIRFPAGFGKGDRKVELTGEAYFEVAHLTPTVPFKVIVLKGEGTTEVEVLGTKLNLNGYGDEGGVQATLLEGSVKVRHHDKAVLLKPGEAAICKEDIQVKEVDAREAMAWKSGKFLFRDASIKSIGEQLKRWYDVEVEYRGVIKSLFNTEIKRDVPLSRVVNALEGTGQVHFELEERKLIIKP